jgi:4-amino-4-deoxy-L-arabinose transferase-like glycosyltransferase
MKFRTAVMLFLLFLLWITPGIIGREPWKADEPYTYGIVRDMIRTGDWVVPTLTGEPFLEKPPLFFIAASLFGRAFAPALELYEAARLATVFFMCLALLFIALAAGEMYGREYMASAAILAMGCALLQEPGHKLITDIALFCGFAMALYGLALIPKRHLAGGFWFGTGAGLGYMAKGLFAPGLLGLSVLALPLLFKQWRSRYVIIAIAAAFLSALPWLIIWPLALYERSPDLFTHWFWGENFGRFLGINDGSVGFDASRPDPRFFYITNIPWLAWPVILPACWTLWHNRRSWREHPAFQAPLVLFLLGIAVLTLSWTKRSLYAVPLLVPITLIAVPAFDTLSDRARNMIGRLTNVFFAVLASAVWLCWLAMMTGFPALLTEKLHAFQPDYVPSVNSTFLLIALLYSVAWLHAVIRFSRSREQAYLNWTLGIVLVWGLVMTLWLPALNSGSSFREAFLSLKRSLPGSYTCVASIGLGESERAMLDHYTGIRTRRLGAAGTGDCDLLLEEHPGSAPSTPRTGWREIWSFRHPNVRPKDVFILYTLKGNDTDPVALH